MNSLFEPRYFSHGRLFYRFEGSDACRFSPKLAYRLLAHLAMPDGEGRRVLWDPFCGAGLLLCVARTFFADAFDVFVGSDIQEEALRCTQSNLDLLQCSVARAKRQRDLRGYQGLNPRSKERWKEVENYLVRLQMGVLEDLADKEHVTYLSSCLELPQDWSAERVCFIGDLPYERMSAFAGSVSEGSNPLEKIFSLYPTAHGLFVAASAQSVFSLPIPGKNIETRPLKGARALISVR